MKTLEMPQARYRGIIRQAHKFEYSECLEMGPDDNVITDVSQEAAYRRAREMGGRPSTCAEEWVLFGNNDPYDDLYEWYHTCDRLLIPEGQKTDYRKTEDNMQYWLRIFCSGFEEINGALQEKDGLLVPKKVADIWVPETGLAREVYPFGIPAKTAPQREHRNGTETHWSFNPKKEEVAVLPDRRWRHHGGRCFRLSARYDPSYSNSSGGFRLIRGSAPQYSVPQAAQPGALAKSEGAVTVNVSSTDYKTAYCQLREGIIKLLRELPEQA